MVTYDRPIEATLHVHLANGETFEATETDLRRFGLVKDHAHHHAFRKALIAAVCERFGYRNVEDALLNPVRVLSEVLSYAPDTALEEIEEQVRAVGDVEQALREAQEAREGAA